MTAPTLEDLLFAARRGGRLLPQAASSQLLCAVVRAAEVQGVAPVPAMFILDAEDGLVLDLSAQEGGTDPVRAAAELGRALLIGPSGGIQGPAAPSVRKALQNGYADLGAFRRALDEACPPLTAENRRRLGVAFCELCVAWQKEADGGALVEALEALAAAPGGSSRAAAPPPPKAPIAAARAASRSPAAPSVAPRTASPSPATPPWTAPPSAPLGSAHGAAARPAMPEDATASEEPLFEHRLAALEGALGRMEPAPPSRPGLRTAGIAAFSALLGAVAATALIRLTATPPPPTPAPERPAPVCPPLLIVHEPAPRQEPPASAPDAGVQLAAVQPPPPPAPAAPASQAARPSTARPHVSTKSKSSGGSRNAASAEAEKGDRALRKGQLDEALAAFQSALTMDGRFAPAVRGLAMVHMTQGREADAKSEYQHYLQLAPDAPDASRIRKVVENLGGQ